MENKLGENLYRNLQLFETENLYVEDIIVKNQVEGDIAEEIVFGLYQRGFIKNLEEKFFKTSADIGLADCFRLTVEGKNYLETVKNSVSNSSEGNVSIQVGNISGNAVIGNNLQNVSVHFGMTFEEVRQYINNLQTANDFEKAQLQQLVVELEKIIEKHKPIKKGMLSKFSSLLRDHSAAIATIFQPFIYRLFNS